MKNSLKELLFLFAMLLLVSCSQDLYEEQATVTKKESIVKRISLRDAFVKQNKKLQEKVSQLKDYKSNKTGKYEYNEIYDFYIDEEN